VRAERPRGAVASECDPGAGVRTGAALASTRGANRGDVFDSSVAPRSKCSAKSHTRKSGHADRRRDLFWVLLLYLMAVMVAIVVACVYLVSEHGTP
jgi:hypothetical protein